MIQYKESELLLRFQTHNKENSKRFRKTLNSLAKSKNLQLSSISLPIERKKFTILKSPHVNKKAKEQYEIRFFNVNTNIESFKFIKKLNIFDFRYNKDLIFSVSGTPLMNFILRDYFKNNIF